MPTLVWVRRPLSGTSSAGASGGVSASVAAAAAAPDSAVSASSAAAVQVALPVVSSKQKASGKETNRKRNRVNAATTAKKKSKTTSGRDLPRGVQKTPSGKFKSEIRWRGKIRYIGMFDTPEQASAAYLSVKRDRDDGILPSCGAAQVDAMFDAAKKTAQESVGIVKRKPRGVQKKPSGNFQASIPWGAKTCYIGTFDTAEQASAAYLYVQRDLYGAELSAVGADEVNTLFDSAKKKALENVGGSVPKDLPRGVQKTSSGKFKSKTRWCGKTRHIGTFHTPEQASAAYMSFKNDIAGAETSALYADEIDSIYDAASKKAVEAVGGRIRKKRRAKAPTERDPPQGVRKLKSGKFQSATSWYGRNLFLGTFDTPEQASAAYMSARKDLDDATVSSCGAHDVDAVFDKAKQKAIDSFGAFDPEKRGLPTGAYKLPSGKFGSRIRWGD